MSETFVHLHTHSEYSLLDGLGRIKSLVSEAKKLGQPALALTDHGVMHGAVEFFRAAKYADIKPIIGVESYQTVWGRPMGGREAQVDRENYHLLLLAKNMTGYRNLLKICSQSHLNGYYYRPRIDHDFLANHAEGLIATTGCMGAEVPQLIHQGKEKEAYERLGWYVDLFGKENFFIELQEHSIPDLVPINKTLVPWAEKFGINLLATNDVHYVREQDGGPHDVLLCVQTGTTVQTKERMRMSDGSYFLKSRAQMEETFRPLIDLPASAFNNSVHIAEMCEVDLEDENYHLPDLPIPDGYNYESYLRHLTEEGLLRLYGESSKSDVVQERKERELSIIHQMGFDIYFLIVADLCNFARRQNIWWNVRGSGAGSLVAYCAGITGIDPLKNNLIFERFLNPGRVSMPDFDLDFPDDQREEMIRYTVNKFGEDQVAQIATFGRMKARAAVRDVGRAKGVELFNVDRIAKLIPAIPGKPVTIQEVLTEGHEFYSPDLVQMYQKEAWAKDLLDTSMQLEGVARHSSVHAAAVIVADRELSHYTPLMRGNKNTVTSTITQYEFPILESIGLLKVDFLGLSTLSVMREATRMIRERHGIEFTLNNIPIEGEESVEAFKLLSSGEVSGVFQVEGQGMRRVLTEMRPSTFEHIVATISLYRPGPLEYIPSFIKRMHGEEEVEYKHKSLENILGETYGICVSGESMVINARTGERRRLDSLKEVDDFHIQGVDANWQPAIGRVTHWIDSGFKEVYQVTLRNGASIKVTGDHRLLTETGWLPLNQLAVGDRLGTPPVLLGPDDYQAAKPVRNSFAHDAHNATALSLRSHGAGLLTAELPNTARKLNVDWQEIVSIEPAGVEHVYDLTVEGLHSFVANNIIVHNCVYQEQIIQILSQLAGYTPGDADLVRRAISKKKASDIEKHKKIFVEGCYQNGIPKDAAGAIYGDIEFFARYGFNKCLPGDVEVIDAATGRLVKIEDLYRGTAKIDQTISCDTDALRLQRGAVTAVMDNGVKPVYRLTTALGRTIEATANHPFFTFEGWRLLEELSVGDQIGVPRTLPVEGKQSWPDHEVIALGHLLAEGNLCHPHSVYYYSKDPAQCEDYVQAIEQFDNVAASIALHKGTYSIYARRQERNQLPGVMLWAESLGLLGKTAHTKEIPGDAFELNNRQVALLISRMWEGDGHINVTGRSLFYATASKRMAHQLQHLLLRLGIISSLRTVEFPYKEGRIGYQLFVTGQTNLEAFAAHIGIHFISDTRRAKLATLCAGEEVGHRLAVKDVIPLGIKETVRAAKETQGISWEAINQACGVAQREFYPTNAATKRGFSRQTIQRLAEYFGNNELRRHATSDLYWDRIVSIEYVGEKQTYDLEIANTHNFIANDILVHNSHAADYAVICVQTAYLKAIYPVEYMAALLLIERDKTEKVINFINECRRMGIDVLPPDVNYSGLDFDIQTRPPDVEPNSRRDGHLAYNFPVPPDSAIRFGMAAVKNVGEGPVNVILAARAEDGPFKSLEDFCERVDLRQVNKRALECLIKVGAFDRFGKRSQILEVLDQMVAQSASVFAARDSGQLSMFDLMNDMAGGAATSVSPIALPNIEEAKGRDRLQWEKELLGVYAMSHPLQALSVDVRNIVSCGCSELNEQFDGKNVLLVGMITTVRTINTKKGDQMAFVQIEDMGGQCEVVVFPKTYAEVKEMLIPDAIVMVKGKGQAREGQTSLLADSFQTYVDQIMSVGADPQYQKPLLDVVPTINGFHLEDSPMSAISDDSEPSTGLSNGYSNSGFSGFGGDDDEGNFMEESPFANEPPAWMHAAVTSEVAKPPISKPTSTAPVLAAPKGKEEAAKDNPYLHESRNLREEDGNFDIPLPKSLQGDAALLAELATPDEPASPKAPESQKTIEEAAPANPYLHESRNLREEDEDFEIALPKHLQNNAALLAKDENNGVNARKNEQPAKPHSNGHRNGHETNGTNGHGSGNDKANDKGNGHTKNGSNGSPQNGHSSLIANGKRTMQIVFRPSGDVDRDKYRLKQIVDTVRDPKGRDQFIIIMKGSGKSTTLAFPDDPCSISDRLRNDLSKFFRVEVQVKE